MKQRNHHLFPKILILSFLFAGSSVVNASYPEFLSDQNGSKVSIPETVVLNGEIRSRETLADVDTFDIRNIGINDKHWNRQVFTDFEKMEDEIGEQIPGRHGLVNTIANSKAPLKYVLFLSKPSDKEDDSEFSNLKTEKINRALLIFSVSDDKFVGQSFWSYSPKPEIFKIRYEKVLPNQYEMDGDMYTYISLELKKDKPFNDLNEKNKKVSHELAYQTGTWFDNRIPLENKSQVIKAPYFWGRYFFSDQSQVEEAKKRIASNESVTLAPDEFETRMFSSIDHFEKTLKLQVPLRIEQINWLASAPSYYLVHVSNPTKRQLPYEHMLHAFDGRSHEQFMTILWNEVE